MARPTFNPTEEQRFTVAQAARIGLEERKILKLIRGDGGKPISRGTLRKHFQTELATGKAEREFKVLSTAYDVATNPNHDRFATMNIWFQKTQLGIREITSIEQLGDDGKPVTPGPLVAVRVGSTAISDDA